jgi:hypothetical protein
VLPDRRKRALKERRVLVVVPGDLPEDPASVAERCAREVLVQTAALGELGALAERLLGRGRVAGPRPGVSQREQQLASRDRLDDDREPHLVQAGRFLVGELRSGPIAGPARVLDGLVGSPGRGGREVVMCELGEVRAQIGGVDRIERLTGTLMEPRPARRSQLVVERVPDQHVPEAQPPGRSRRLADEALGHGLVQEVEQLVASQPAELRQRVQLELPAHDRGSHEQVPAALREP